VTGSFHKGDQGGQVGANQATLVDVQRHGSLVALLTVIAPILRTGVLFDHQRRLGDIDLLHDLGEVGFATQQTAAAGAGVQGVFLEASDLH
jgi:hypothetical protein